MSSDQDQINPTDQTASLLMTLQIRRTAQLLDLSWEELFCERSGRE